MVKVHSTPLKGISVRRDKNAISLFDRSNGTKVRFAIGPYTKAKRPELVDIKITDFCPAQCSFCLDPETMVTLDTARRIPIKDLQEGDKIWAFHDPFLEGNKYVGTTAIVEKRWNTSKESLRIYFEDGRTIITSLDHKFLMARMGWRVASRLKPGDRIRSHPITPQQSETSDFMRGYLAGFSRGDGAFRDWGHGANGRYIRLSCGNKDVINRLYFYMSEFGLDPYIKKLWVPEGAKTCWGIEKRSQRVVEWFSQTRLFDSSNVGYRRGFVSGFFDSDGSSNGMKAIRFHQKNDMEALDLVRNTLIEEGFQIGKIATSKETGTTTINVSSTFESVERFSNIFIPINSRRNYIRSNKSLGKERFCRITHIENVGVRDLIDIQTSTGTFFAEGLATHNCYQGSTPSGEHSTMENMENVIYDLAKAKVQEVACLEKSTLVATPSGMTPIGDLVVGSEVYDSNGRISQVIKVRHSTRNTVKLKGNRGFEVVATPDHPFIVSGKEMEAKDCLGRVLDSGSLSLSNKTPPIDMSKYIGTSIYSKSKVGNNKNAGVKIVSIEPSGEREVVDITLDEGSSHMFQLSHAVLSHNCGGGETTYHPQFAEICKKFAQAGVVPNFTTKYPARVRMHWDNIKDYIGGFAYSAETPKNIYDAAKLLKNAGIPDHKVSLHHVMGLSRQGQFREYMQAAHAVGYRVTLLGYKTTGRGKNVTPFPYDWWIEEMNSLIREGRCPSTSIDTPLAEQYDGLMPVEPTMYHTREGAFSMYIDAVQMKMGASSFDESVDLVPFDKDWVARYKHL